MKWLKSIVSLVFVLCSLSGMARAQIIQNPFKHFIENTELLPDDRLISFTANFGQDKQIFFVSLTRFTNGKAGNIWKAYAKASNGYEPLDQSLSLRRDAASLTTVEGLDGLALVSYWPGNAEHGVLMAFQIEGDKIIEHNLGEIEPLGKDAELYSSLFSAEATNQITIDEQSIPEARASSVTNDISSNGRPPEKITNLQSSPNIMFDAPPRTEINIGNTNSKQPILSITDRPRGYLIVGGLILASIFIGFVIVRSFYKRLK